MNIIGLQQTKLVWVLLFSFLCNIGSSNSNGNRYDIFWGGRVISTWSKLCLMMVMINVENTKIPQHVGQIGSTFNFDLATY